MWKGEYRGNTITKTSRQKAAMTKKSLPVGRRGNRK